MVRTVFILLLFTSSFSKSQTPIEKAIEYLQKFSIHENDWENTAVILEDFINHPLQINNLDFDRIKEFPLLNSRHFFVIKKYRELNGNVLTFNELVNLPFFTPELVKIIAPFVRFDFKNSNSNFKGFLMHKTSFNIEKPKGYTRTDGLNYMGGKTHEISRFKLLSSKHKFSLVWEKDKGEKVNFSFIKMGYQGNFKKKLKQVNVGAYSLNIGEGLIHSNSFIVGKNNPISSFYKIQNSLRINSSSTEYNYESGTAFIYNLGRITLKGFYSINPINGNLKNDTISSIKQDGLFRTSNEIKHKNIGHYQIIGSNVKIEHKKTTFCFNTLKTNFSIPFCPSQNYYNMYYPIHKLWNNSINYRFFDGDKTLKGEIASDKNGNLATTHFLAFKIGDSYNLMTNLRYFSPKYSSFRPNTLSENSKIKNEKALLFAGDFENEKIQFYASADFFGFPNPKYRIQLPSIGRDFMGYINYHVSDSLSLKLFLKKELKSSNEKEVFLNVPVKYKLTHFYGKLRIKATKKIEAISRLDIRKHQTSGTTSFGRTSYLELVHRNKVTTVSARLIFFKTDNWDTRIYLYEKDVLYHFSIPVLYDEGTRFYINFNRSIGNKIKLWVKYGRTVYNNKQSIGTGDNEITGNLKTEIRAQIRINF